MKSLKYSDWLDMDQDGLKRAEAVWEKRNKVSIVDDVVEIIKPKECIFE